MQLLNLHNLSAGYEGRAIVSGVNLSVSANDYIGVIGPNGGGKTTLIKTILGILKPIGGSIEYADRSMKIGYLPQANTIDREFPITVLDTVLSGLSSSKGLCKRYTKADRIAATAQLEKAAVAMLSNEYIGNLSGGQLQRVLLCRAMISQPRLLILDEPTTYVDNKFEKELYTLLHELNRNIAIIMVSHDLGTISSHVKSIACVNRSFHYHQSNIISAEQLRLYDCPIQLLRHGDVPHTVLKRH